MLRFGINVVLRECTDSSLMYEVGNHDGAYKGYSGCNCIVVLYNTK